jgi:DNA-binding NarL/FixJ family response regulator
MKEVEENGRNSADDFFAEDIVALVCSTPIWRDCLMSCLEFESYAVLPFATLASWFDVRSHNVQPDVLLLCEPTQKDLPLIAKIDKSVATIVIGGGEGGLNPAQLVALGVRGIIPTETPFSVAVNAIRVVQAGGTFIPAGLFAGRESLPDFGRLLTQRQIDVIEALRQGKANKQIAHELNLRESTVKVHIRQIMRKLDARNRTEIAVLANELLEINRSADEEA